MKKFFGEFKTFITRGNVVDLAVGMIIGAAFTAIVTALVNNIFKPLIDCIPMGDVQGLITMLVPRDANGVEIVAGLAAGVPAAVDLSKSTYIDWGAFIMAIINFLLTAMVLFLIVKLINTLRDGRKNAKKYQFTPEERAEMKTLGLSRKQMRARLDERAAQAAEAEAAKAAAEAEANKPEALEDILKDIRELLRAGQTEQAAEKLNG